MKRAVAPASERNRVGAMEILFYAKHIIVLLDMQIFFTAMVQW